RHLDPDDVGPGLAAPQPARPIETSGERRERVPLDVFRQDRSELGLARLVESCHRGTPSSLMNFVADPGGGACECSNRHAACFRALVSTSMRRRLPVAAKIALAIAGTITDVVPMLMPRLPPSPPQRGHRP